MSCSSLCPPQQRLQVCHGQRTRSGAQRMVHCNAFDHDVRCRWRGVLRHLEVAARQTAPPRAGHAAECRIGAAQHSQACFTVRPVSGLVRHVSSGRHKMFASSARTGLVWIPCSWLPFGRKQVSIGACFCAVPALVHITPG